MPHEIIESKMHVDGEFEPTGVVIPTTTNLKDSIDGSIGSEFSAETVIYKPSAQSEGSLN